MASSKYSVTVPFKESEKWMYEVISEHTSKSAFIKDCLKDYFNSLKTQVAQNEPEQKCTEEINTDSFLDF